MNQKMHALIVDIIGESFWHLQTLRMLRNLDLPDWAIGAGFVRNAVWDRLHGYHNHTPLSDIDVLYFDPENTDPAPEKKIEAKLFAACPDRPWSVRNQARMHVRNSDSPYKSTADAMSYWLETPTCVAVRLDDQDEISLISPFGVADLVEMRANPTATGYKKYDQYLERMIAKNWPQKWPKVEVKGLR